MHRLIKFKRTGTPEEFAERMNISSSFMYRLLNDLKQMGGPIVYCPIKRSYVYAENVELQLGFVRTETADSTVPITRQLVPDRYVKQSVC
jgi:hypothetical protein